MVTALLRADLAAAEATGDMDAAEPDRHKLSSGTARIRLLPVGENAWGLEIC